MHNSCKADFWYGPIMELAKGASPRSAKSPRWVQVKIVISIVNDSEFEYVVFRF